MSWLCSRALVEEFLAATSSDGARSVLSSSNPMPQAFLPQDKMTAFSRPSRSGMTFGPLTEDLGADLLTWFLVDSRVRTYQLPGMAPESTASAQDSGEKWHESSVRYDRDSSSWRTHRSLFEEDLPWSSVTLPSWGMTLDGVLWEPPTSGRPISVIASGLLPTPTTVDTGSLFNKSDSPGAKNRPTLGAMAKFNLWPTPVRRDYRAPGRSRLERTGSKAGECLPQIVGGQLNPTWVEWLMNWPMGWTSLEAITHEHFKHWQESGAAYLRGDRMPEVWFDQDPSEAPQGSEPFEQCSREYRDSLSYLPQERALERRDVGSRISRSSNLRDMQITISAKKESPERSCALRGSEMLERDWKARGIKEMVSRTATGMTDRIDRIKALGNGQVPRVAATAFTYLASECI